jgi:isoquinoline 1-oxidoreductase beta subunit
MERREFLQVSFVAGIGLIVGCLLPHSATASSVNASAADASGRLIPNAWVRIDKNGTVTVVINHSEMGQGIFSALAMIVAEELETDWNKIRTEMASMDPVYVNPAFGVQATGGSTSVRTSWEELRKAGAVTRELLISAAASSWGVSSRECRAENGKVIHQPTDRSIPYGDLVEKAATMPIPGNVPLKEHRDFKLIGNNMPRLDTLEKVEGQAVFGIDVRQKDLLTATILHPPVYGARVKSFDPAKAKSMPGVRYVLPISTGIAVVADRFWQAKKASEAVHVEWDLGRNANLSSESIRARWVELAEQNGKSMLNQGNVGTAMKNAAKVIEAVYELPFQAHGCPEPMNCTASVRDDGCDVWAPVQNQGGAQEVASAISGLAPDRVRIHTTFLGGGFGRRGDVDFVIEAVELSKAVKAPVKVIWTREEDIWHDHFRPASYHVLRAGLNASGMPVAFHHRSVSPAWMNDTIEILAPAIMPRWMPRFMKNAVASAAIPVVKYAMSAKSASSGAIEMGYAFDHIRVEFIEDDPGVPTGAWRSVANSRHAFAIESFIDEIAVAGGKDPLQLRLDLLKNSPKRRDALKLAAEKAEWEKKPPAEIYRGISVHDFHDTPAAMVAEVSVDKSGQVKVHRVVCAVHCGTVINPRNVEVQISGAIAFGLTATLKSSITIAKGRAEQSNLDDFPIMKMDEMPEVEVHIVPSTAAPTGIGEVGVPPIAPAIANAVFAATGKRIRKLPITRQDIQSH